MLEKFIYGTIILVCSVFIINTYIDSKSCETRGGDFVRGFIGFKCINETVK